MPHECIQELRIAKMEAKMEGQNVQIANLVKRLDNLLKGLWALILTLIPTSLGLLGFLIWEVIHK